MTRRSAANRPPHCFWLMGCCKGRPESTSRAVAGYGSCYGVGRRLARLRPRRRCCCLACEVCLVDGGAARPTNVETPPGRKRQRASASSAASGLAGSSGAIGPRPARPSRRKPLAPLRGRGVGVRGFSAQKQPPSPPSPSPPEAGGEGSNRRKPLAPASGRGVWGEGASLPAPLPPKRGERGVRALPDSA